jgi:hypothetical protein
VTDLASKVRERVRGATHGVDLGTPRRSCEPIGTRISRYGT